MILSTHTLTVYGHFDIKETFDKIAKAGFAGVDFNFDAGDFCLINDKQYFLDLRKYAEDKGLTIHMAHAPWPSSFNNEEETEEAFVKIVQAIKNASYLGAKMIVVHPFFHLDPTIEGNMEKMFDLNVEFFKKLAPYAKEYNVKIAIENIGAKTACSTPEMMNEIYDTLNDPIFTICVDTGHFFRINIEPAEAVIKIGKRLVNGCLHVQDTVPPLDMHTLPFYGKINWEEMMKALAEIGYEGELNLETFKFLKDLPKQVMPSALEYMASVGNYLIERFEYYKNEKN